MKIKIDRFFYAAASLALLLCLLIVGAPVLKPLVFALMLSIMLLPVEKFIERFIPSRLAAIIITILLIIVLIGAVGSVFFFQGKAIFSEFDSLSAQLSNTVSETIDWVNNKTPFQLRDVQQEAFNLESLPGGVMDFLSSGFTSTISTLTLFFLTLLFLLFFMLYRNAFADFVKIQFTQQNRTIINNILENIRHTLVHYLSGLGIVMVIMAVLNSLGLWILGVDYPIFFGVLAALLTIVPYIGTTLGGTLPILYVLATGGGILQAFLIMAFYFTIQQIEGNFITPKIVGDSVKINPFIAIVGVTFGAFIWGIAGIILAIPVLGVFRCVFQEIDATKPLAFVLSNKINTKGHRLLNEFDEDKYRISTLFKKKAKSENN